MSRDYTRLLTLVVLLIATTLLGIYYFRFECPWTKRDRHKISSVAPGITPQERFQEGKHYQKLPAKITTNVTVQQFIAETPGKIQVIGFFSYACFWCQRLHPFLNEWIAKQPPSTIILYRFPVVFAKGWDVIAKAYYIVEALQKNQSLDIEFFNAIHKDHIDLSNEKLLEDFFAKHGIPSSKFLELYNSFEINQAYTRGNQIANAFEVTVSPAVIINLPSGSYLVTANMAGSEQAVIDVMEFLIARESKTSNAS